jgi:hypothetical protein
MSLPAEVHLSIAGSGSRHCEVAMNPQPSQVAMNPSTVAPLNPSPTVDSLISQPLSWSSSLLSRGATAAVHETSGA